MVIACWWWMVETPPVPACRAPPQSQRSHQTAAAPNSCNTRNQNQFCQLCRRLYMEHCCVSCGDIFGHFHPFNETNLQIFGRNPSVPGVHKPANNSQLLDVMGTSFTDGVLASGTVPKYGAKSLYISFIFFRWPLGTGQHSIGRDCGFSQILSIIPAPPSLSSHLSTSFNLAKFPDSFLGSNITDYPHTIRDHLSSVTLIGRRSQD